MQHQQNKRINHISVAKPAKQTPHRQYPSDSITIASSSHESGIPGESHIATASPLLSGGDSIFEDIFRLHMEARNQQQGRLLAHPDATEPANIEQHTDATQSSRDGAETAAEPQEIAGRDDILREVFRLHIEGRKEAHEMAGRALACKGAATALDSGNLPPTDDGGPTGEVPQARVQELASSPLLKRPARTSRHRRVDARRRTRTACRENAGDSNDADHGKRLTSDLHNRAIPNGELLAWLCLLQSL
jgi:hypothetical protein